MAALVHSASRVAAYQRCPRRYYWRYVVKAPRRLTAEQALGINIHAALEAFERAGGRREGGAVALRSALAATWRTEGFASGEEAHRCRQEAERRLQRYLEDQQGAAPQGEPLMLEQRLEGTIGRFRVVGVVDRLDRSPDGSLTLIDYKTGRDDRAGVSLATLQQLAIYRSLVTQVTSRAPARVVVTCPGEGDQELALDDTGWGGHLERAQRVMEAIEADQDFEARVDPSCQRCEFAGRCVPWQRALAAPGETAP
ncbi:MAG: PD-(D/E)XK nuclease family protein [Candidatus Sericytochromatia bacterium]|nr:PD-(D/E)XK nuclease family protein [Candidatus Sericytochromatia bacterium]